MLAKLSHTTAHSIFKGQSNMRVSQSCGYCEFKPFQPIPAHFTPSSQLYPIPAGSSIIQFIPAHSCPFQHIPSTSNICYPIPSYSSPFQPFLAHSLVNQLQPIPAHYSPFQYIPDRFSIFQFIGFSSQIVDPKSASRT